MTMFLSTPSPHEAFSMMLMERLEKLEDEHRSLKAEYDAFKTTVGDYIPYEWFRFTFSMPVVPDTVPDNIMAERHYDTYRESCINQLFSTRSQTNPCFAVWFWQINVYDTGDLFELTVYIRFATWTPIHAFEALCQSSVVKIHPLQGGLAEVQDVLWERFGHIANNMGLHCLPDYGIDIWRRGGEEMNAPMEFQWTTGDFLESVNYKQPYFIRDAFINWMIFLIQSKHWSRLFHLQTI